ncbi:amidohydrolase family protein [Hydrotalea sp.]|uniref:amidohydrolase family protein n=1 Tax=Hydrotalea sp. TaxID=2881279 RepID=UPI002608D56D|nr:amidohydrolase family protein [Hydrotalea sp.]
MKTMRITLILVAIFMMNAAAFAQDDILPAKPYIGRLFITNGTVHVGNGTVIDKATIEVNNGKIVAIHTSEVSIPAEAKKVDATGKQVYPGLILPNTDLGLKEIANGVRGSNDYLELGDLNPNVRSIVAYNTDSKIINTLKANGILLASVTPEGGSISGSSSVVQLDAWNWEDAAYKMDNNIHMNMPSFIRRPGRRFGAFNPENMPDPSKEAYEKIDELKNFFRQAKAYIAESKHTQTNLKFEAVKGLFDGSKHLFIHADQVKQMLAAIDFAKEFGFKVTLVGASDSYQIAGLLNTHNISVILNQEHALPTTEDDDVDQPFKTPGELQKAGVLFALNDAFDEARYRNLMFNAGTAATYGLTKEQALQAITLNSAKILGIDDRTGSIEVGKEANIVVSDGDILDMHSSIIRHAFIQGREVSLENKQTELNRKYLTKYGFTQ